MVYKKSKCKHNKILKWSVISAAFVMFLGISFFFGVQVYVTQFAKQYIVSDAEKARESDAMMVLGARV